MKKKLLFTTALIAIGVIGATIVVPKAKNQITNISHANESLTRPNCETLKKSYPTISQILNAEYNSGYSHVSNTTYTSWGTVTAIYTQGNYYHAFVQNNAEGSTSAALCLYNLGPTSSSCPVLVGDFLTFTGQPTYYRGMYEILMNQGGNSFEVHRNITSYPVEAEVLPYEYLTAEKGTDLWDIDVKKGNVKVQLNNVEPSYTTENYAEVRTSDYTVIKVYYGGIGQATNIYNKIKDAARNNQKVNITGYLNNFDHTSTETQLLIRNPEDIVTSEGDDHITVTDLYLDTYIDFVKVGETLTIGTDVGPIDAQNKTLTWTSSDPSVATVNQNGVVTGIKEGTASITATSNDNPSVSGTCTIFVEGSIDDVEPTSITINLSKVDGSISGLPYINAKTGDKGTVSYTVNPSNATDKSVYFLSDDSNVVRINSSTGEWEVVGTGMSGITVISNANAFNPVYASFIIVNVGSGDSGLISISFEESEMNLYVNEEVEIPFTTMPANFDASGILFQSGEGYFDILSVDRVNKTVTIKGNATESDFLYAYHPDYPGAETIIDFNFTVNNTNEEINLRNVSVGSYNTNFGTKSDVGNSRLKYAYYRAGQSTDGIKLYPSVNMVRADDNSLPGSFSNETAKYAFSKIDVTYSGAGTLRYGPTKDCTNSYNLPSSTRDNTVSVNTNDAFFFYVEADKGETLDLIKLNYKLNTNKTFNSSITTNKRNNTRIPATVYSGTLTPGVSYVDVPTDITVNGSSYTVNSTKRYTYYTFDYVQANKSTLNLDNIALTDPVDVANYFIAFHCPPVNYISYNKASLDASVGANVLGSQTNVQQLFGNKARYVSMYNRTDGYAIGLPYAVSSDNKPVYLEFDFDGNGKYSLSSRDVCRVVLWASGWNGTGYGENIPVATYTDDHYVTFREFNNYGGWNEPFDSINNGNYTQTRTNYNYGSTKTFLKSN
mgnify:CR=1 FL=1